MIANNFKGVEKVLETHKWKDPRDISSAITWLRRNWCCKYIMEDELFTWFWPNGFGEKDLQDFADSFYAHFVGYMPEEECPWHGQIKRAVDLDMDMQQGYHLESYPSDDGMKCVMREQTPAENREPTFQPHKLIWLNN